MDKQELLNILENGMTVDELIKKLNKFDKNMLVINSRDKEHLPIADVDDCYDEIVTKRVVSIW